MKVALVLCVLANVAAAEPAPNPPDAKPADAKPADAKSLTKFDITKVEALFDQGTKHYDLGEWDAAIAAFKRAYDQMPDPSFLFNLGQAYRQKGRCREATAAYKSYLRKATDDRAKVEQFIRELEPCVKIEEENARRLLPPPPPPPPPELSPRHRTLRRAAWITLGAGALALGGAGLFAVRAIRTERESERCNQDPCAGTRVIELDDRGTSAERWGRALGVIGAALVTTGTGIYLYTRVRPEYVTVHPTAGGGLVVFGKGF